MAQLLRRINLNYVNRAILKRTLSSVAKNNEKPLTDPAAASKNSQIVLLSESCQKRLKEICTDGTFLRILVEGGGCSGFQYKFELDNKLLEDDVTFGPNDGRVVIDATSLEYCSGSTVDYHTELIRSGFRMMANPKAEQGCSCGASFALKLD